MNENFFGQTAVYVSSPYCAEASCQVSAKSLGWFSGKTVYRLTNGQCQAWPQLTLRTVACFEARAQRQSLPDSLTSWHLDFFTTWLAPLFRYVPPLWSHLSDLSDSAISVISGISVISVISVISMISAISVISVISVISWSHWSQWSQVTSVISVISVTSVISVISNIKSI